MEDNNKNKIFLSVKRKVIVESKTCLKEYKKVDEG